MDTYYVGAYGIVPIAVDTHKENVITYMKTIRKIPKGDFTIRSQKLDFAMAYANFERELLEEFDKGLYLPRRDCEKLGKDLDCLEADIARAIEWLNQMSSYAEQSKKYRPDIQIYSSTTSLLTRILNKRKHWNAYETAAIFSSPIFTWGIFDYLKFVKQDNEEQRNRLMYRMSLMDGEYFDKR